MSSVYETLAERHKPYRQAEERHRRALEAQTQADERVEKLERELRDAEDRDRQQLGDALIDGAKPAAAAAPKIGEKLEQAKTEQQAVAYAASRAGEELDRLPAENRDAWLRQAKADFQQARGDYEAALEAWIAARERLAVEASLVGFLATGQEHSIGFAARLPVLVSGVAGLRQEVPAADVFDALRSELADVELDVLLVKREPVAT